MMPPFFNRLRTQPLLKITQRAPYLVGILGLFFLLPLAFAQSKNTTPNQSKSTPKAATTNSALSAQWMFEILLGEINALEGQAPTAFALILDVAKKSGDEKAFERAIEIALKSRSAEAALEAARAWREAQPNSQSANQYLVQILIALNQLSEVEPALARLLLITPKDEKIELIRSIPRQFTRVQNKALAAQVVERVLEGSKSNRSLAAAAWSAVGQMRLLANDQEGAMNAVQKGNQIEPQSADPIWLALGLMELRYLEAENFLQRLFAQKSPPVEANVHFAYAKILLQNQENKAGIEQLLAITKKHPDMPLPWLYLASAQLESDMVPQAQSHFLKFLSLQESRPTPMNEREASQAYFGLAQIAQQQGDLNKAEEWLTRITQGPSRVSAYIQRALILNKKGQGQRAVDLILSLPEDTSVERKSKNTALAQIYRDQKNFAKSLDVLKETFKQNPMDDDLTYEMAMAYEKINRLDEMELALKVIIQRNPNYHAALNALGYSLADRNLRLPQAREYIVKALEMSPEDPFIMDSLGWVEFRMGKLQEALAILKRAYAIKPDADIAAHLGEVMFQAGQKEEALKLWRMAIEKSPDNEVLQETLKRLGIHI
jgi:tetratricopeptide (TPR) repeat protein